MINKLSRKVLRMCYFWIIYELCNAVLYLSKTQLPHKIKLLFQGWWKKRKQGETATWFLYGTLQYQTTIWVPNMWKLIIGSFLQMLAHLTFGSLFDMQGNGLIQNLKELTGMLSLLVKKIKKTIIQLKLWFSYISNLLKHIGHIIQWLICSIKKIKLRNCQFNCGNILVTKRFYSIVLCNTLFWPFLSFIFLIEQINHWIIRSMCFNKLET